MSLLGPGQERERACTMYISVQEVSIFRYFSTIFDSILEYRSDNVILIWFIT